MGKSGIQPHEATGARSPGTRDRANSGTVLILHEEESLVDRLRQVFHAASLEVRVYACHHDLLASSLPNGPACLVAYVSGGAKCGLAAYEELKQNGVYLPVVFLAIAGDSRLAVKAMRAGAEDFLPVPFQNHELLAAASQALDRSRQFVKNCENYLELRRSAASLTEREREIIKLVVAGMLNKEIAVHLGLALVTVKVHRGNAMRKLGARTGAELARIARAVRIGDGSNQTPPLPPTNRYSHNNSSEGNASA